MLEKAGKWPDKVATWKKLFIEAGLKNGYDKKLVDLLVQLIIDNSGYGFNKCLSGKERIFRQKSQHFSPTIEEMYKIKNDINYAKERNKLSLRKKYKANGYGEALSMSKDGRLRSNKIIDIYYSGVKEVYLVETEDGETVKCTMNHSFPTPNGKKMLSELSVGDALYTVDSYENQKYEKLNTIRHKNTPVKGQKGFQKGGPIGTWFFDEYRELKLGEKCELCNNLGKELHHIDHNHDNNVKENFQWLCVSCHKKKHYEEGRTKRYEKGILTKTSKIKSITFIEEENVYDIEMTAPDHNLLMENGIIVSNSHSISYSIISYWTAYMKANFPLVFYTAMLNGNPDDADLFMAEARKLDIQILPPHVNNSRPLFSVEGEKGIRAGFNAIKGVGPKAVESIIENQPFTSIDDYFERNGKAAINKGVVGALIRAGALSNLGIEISPSDIPSELDEKFEYKMVNDKRNVFLTREQMELWYEYLNEVNTKKTVKNYLVPPEIIKGKYFDQYEFIEEKDGGIVIPEDKLGDLDLKIKDLIDQTSTRKRPKGSFDKSLDPMKNISAFRKPFVLYHREISKVTMTYLDMYLKESNELGFSFLPHPLEKNIDKIDIFSEKEDDQLVTTAGIITNIETRKTKRGNPYYWITVKSPRDSVRVTLWDNQMQALKDKIRKNALVVVQGKKGYGGISCDQLKAINFKDK